MPYRTRGVFAGDESVASETARTAVLAKAFNDAAGEYFEREHEYEQGIETNREQIQSLRLVVGAAVVVGIALALVGRSLPSVAVGAVVALAGVGYSYLRYARLKDEIRQYQEQMAINSPDGSVSTVAQVGVPFYLVPYDEEYLIFDGLGETPTNEIELAQIDTDRLTAQQEELANLVDVYDESLHGNHVTSPEYLDEVVPDASDHRELERPLAAKIDEMRATVKHPETEQRSVAAHGTNTVAQSIASLSAADELLPETDLPELSTDPSRADWDQAVADARGLRHDALDETTLAPIREASEHARELTDPAVERLETNQEAVEAHYEAHTGIIDETTHKQTCRECLLERCDRLAEELSLLEEVLDETTGEFGATLDDPDLKEVAADGGVTAQQEVQGEITAALPTASEELRKAYNSLPDLADDVFCPEHGETERVSVPADGVLFGAVWRCLYDEFREGVLEAAEELESTALQRREQKEEDMVNLAQYEGISDLLEREYRNVEAQEATAAKIDRIFDQLETQLVEVESPTQPVDAPTRQDDESPEEFRDRLESRLEQKKEQVRRTKQEVLDSYSQDVRELTDQFLAEMPDGKESIDAVDEEFQHFWDRRRQVLSETEAHGDVATANYEKRLSTLTDSRVAFADAIESFLRRRESTAQAVTDQKTAVGQAEGFDRIVVPFWVVFIEREEGDEDVRVYPILNRDDSAGQPGPGRPYVEHLEPHPEHDYEAFVDVVREQLSDAALLDQLRSDADERDETRFADPGVLRENDAIADSFVDELQRYEL
jgi:hypothetical protein